ncbi:MAG: hypothetical protein AB1750_20930 [Chloroflexota bacterium]
MSKRLPKFADILPVFAVIAVMFYGWSLVVFLWKLPGWLFFLNVGEIAVIFANELVTNLAESLAILLLLLAVCAILPARFLRDDFAARGGIAALTVIGAMMLFLNRVVEKGAAFNRYLYWWMLGTVALAVFLAWLGARVKFLRAAVTWLADRLIVFLFVLLPLTALGMIVVIARFFM